MGELYLKLSNNAMYKLINHKLLCLFYQHAELLVHFCKTQIHLFVLTVHNYDFSGGYHGEIIWEEM